jgi:hypothetical protein
VTTVSLGVRVCDDEATELPTTVLGPMARDAIGFTTVPPSLAPHDHDDTLIVTGGAELGALAMVMVSVYRGAAAGPAPGCVVVTGAICGATGRATGV